VEKPSPWWTGSCVRGNREFALGIMLQKDNDHNVSYDVYPDNFGSNVGDNICQTHRHHYVHSYYLYYGDSDNHAWR